MTRIIYVGAAHGARKTQIVERAVAKLRDAGHEVFHIDAGDYIRDVISRYYQDRKFSQLSDHEKRRVNIDAFREVKPTLEKHAFVVVSGHFAVSFGDPDKYIAIPLDKDTFAQPLASVADHLVFLNRTATKLRKQLKEPHGSMQFRQRTHIANKLMARETQHTYQKPLTIIPIRSEKDAVSRLENLLLKIKQSK